MPLSVEDRLKGNKLIVALLLFLNIITGILVIWCVLSIQIHLRKENHNEYRQNLDLFKRRVVEAYDTMKGIAFVEAKILPGDDSNKSATLEFLSLLKPVSQFSGLDFNDKSKVNRQNPNISVLRNWANSEGSDRNLLWNGMTYEKGSISVPVKGLYQVHCHVKFYVESNILDDGIRQFEHKIFRYNAKSGRRELVVRNTISECREGINDGAHLEYSSDIGSILHLNAGDLVTVKVTDYVLLKHDRDWHNFGAYLI